LPEKDTLMWTESQPLRAAARTMGYHLKKGAARCRLFTSREWPRIMGVKVNSRHFKSPAPRVLQLKKAERITYTVSERETACESGERPMPL
jgi:hypothetical protein